MKLNATHWNKALLLFLNRILLNEQKNRVIIPDVFFDAVVLPVEDCTSLSPFFFQQGDGGHSFAWSPVNLDIALAGLSSYCATDLWCLLHSFITIFPG